MFTPPPAPRTNEPSAFREGMQGALNLAFGLWPITAIVLLCTGLVIMAGNNGSP